MPPLVLNHRKNLSGDGKKRKDENKTELSDRERENVIKIVLFQSLLFHSPTPSTNINLLELEYLIIIKFKFFACIDYQSIPMV
jgi:hypothetical protein